MVSDVPLILYPEPEPSETVTPSSVKVKVISLAGSAAAALTDKRPMSIAMTSRVAAKPMFLIFLMLIVIPPYSFLKGMFPSL